jgi:hypothetical protein
MNNLIYLRRRSKIVLPPSDRQNGELLPAAYIATALKNLEALGYVFSLDLITACRTLTPEQFVVLYQELVTDLKARKGADHEFAPMYPNFPEQVMQMGEGELYFNAIIHYWTDGRFLPHTEVKERFPLLDEVELSPIDLGTVAEFEGLFGKIASSNTSLSVSDIQDLAWFVRTYKEDIKRLMPEAIPQKETASYVAQLLVEYTSREFALPYVEALCKTATDVLRFAVAMCEDGDVSLATATKFRSFKRSERVLLLGLVDRFPNPTEDMLRWKDRWIRLGERLHPGEYAGKFPTVAKAFSVLRNDEPYETFNSQIEKTLADKKAVAAATRLSTRPGDFARRLDHLLRLDTSTTSQEAVLLLFNTVAEKVSTPVLMQVRQHFGERTDTSGLRVFFPKGNLAKAQGIENTLPALSEALCARVVAMCEKALTERFAALPKLGKVYIDPLLRDYTAPFAMRSASKALRTLVRGTKLPLPPGDVLRFFVWWKNGRERTDIDLSATLFDTEFQYVDILSYYNLQGFGGVHSGDIVDAPEGASEFIDISREKLREKNVRYVVMSLNSYSLQPYIELPECFAGWMSRQAAGSGEIFEPKTVQNKLDITADTTISLPLIIDVTENKLIWCDMALRSQPNWRNNVHSNMRGFHLTLRSMVDWKKPNLYDLFVLHAKARGEIVAQPEQADTVFSVENETPFQLEEIASQYMA